MLIPTRLKARNLGPHGKLDLPLRPGPVLVVGENQYDGFDSNGSGKSYLLEGIYWCLFGALFRGSSADSIIRRGSKIGTVVELTLEDSETKDIYVIRRYREFTEKDPDLGRVAGNALVLLTNGKLTESYRGRKTGVGVIEGLIGCTAREFIDLHFVTGTTVNRFSAATDKTRKELLEPLVNSTIDFDRSLDECKSSERAIADEIIRLEERRNGLSNLIIYGDTERPDAGEDPEDVKKLLDDAKDELRKAGEAVDQANLEFDRASKAQEPTRLKRSKFEHQVFLLREQLASLPEEGDCPTCHQEVSKKTLAGLRKRYQEELDKAKSRLSTAREADEALVATVLDAQAALSKASAVHTSLRTRVRELRERHLAAEGAREEAERRSSVRRSSLVADMRAVTRELRGAESKLAYVQFWKQAFGPRGIRAESLRGVINSTNHHLGEYLDVLSGGTMDAYLELDESAGVQIKVDTPTGESTYEELSSGEKRRVDIAMSFARREVLVEASGRPLRLQLLILDEVFESMDRAGIGAVAELLSTFSQTIQGPVPTVTHLDFLKAMIERRITVVRGPDGVSRTTVAGL